MLYNIKYHYRTVMAFLFFKLSLNIKDSITLEPELKLLLWQTKDYTTVTTCNLIKF